jgi:diguanylate cyclase (GGDEF)-like protein
MLDSPTNTLDIEVNISGKVDAVYIFDKNEQLVTFYDKSNIHKNLESVDFLGKNLSISSKQISSICFDKYIAIALPIFGETGYIGSIIAFFNLNLFNTLLEHPNLFASSIRLVYDNKGALITRSNHFNSFTDIESIKKSSNLIARIEKEREQNHDSGNIFFKLNQNSYYANYKYQNLFKWTVVSGIDKSEFYRPIAETAPLFILFLLIFVFGLGVALQATTKMLTGPIQLLINGIKEAKKYNYKIQINKVSVTYFDEIIDSFNDLIAQVDSDTEKLKRLHFELEVLTTNIPGGLFICEFEKDYPFQLLNTPFVKLFGFKDRETLLAKTNSLFLNTVYKEDIALVDAAIKFAAKDNKEGIVEFRIPNKQELKWISCNFRLKNQNLFGITTDVTDKHIAFEKLRRGDERYQIMLDQTDEVLFEWSIDEEKFVYLSNQRNWIAMFGSMLTDEANLLNGSLYEMYPEDRSRFVAKIKEIIESKQRQLRIDVRLKKEDLYFWTRFILTTLLDDDNNVNRIVGRIHNIDDEKSEAIRLIGLSNTDPLTTLLNRRGFEESVNRILNLSTQNENRHALVMVDIDNFKEMNDCYGHLFGDEVLVKVANMLKTSFRTTDLFGRLGGDEFAILLVNFNDEKILINKIELLLNQLKDGLVSCSLGIAFYPKSGTTFKELYKKADKELYTVKNSTKDNYSIAK